MAKRDGNATTENTRTEPITVGPDRSLGLAAAFDGIYHLFGGRVEKWDVTEDGLVAENFTVDTNYDPERILTDVNAHVRRAPLWPTLRWIGGAEPDPFKSPEAITTFMVQYFKGAEEQGSSKSPVYVREAAAAYKERSGTKAKRGPKPKSISLKNLADVNESVLLAAGVSRDDIEHLMEIARRALDQTPANAETASV